MPILKIEQIDKDLFSAEYSASKAVKIGAGIVCTYKVQSFGRSESMAREKILIGLMELMLSVEDEVQKMEV